jgi:hypothetical protein
MANYTGNQRAFEPGGAPLERLFGDRVAAQIFSTGNPSVYSPEATPPLYIDERRPQLAI